MNAVIRRNHCPLSTKMTTVDNKSTDAAEVSPPAPAADATPAAPSTSQFDTTRDVTTSEEGTEEPVDVNVNVADPALEDTQHTAVSNKKLGRRVVPSANVAENGKDDVQHVKSTVKTNNVNRQNRPASSIRRNVRNLGSYRGQRQSLEFGTLPQDIEVRPGNDEENEESDATWGDVARSCCCHTPKEWSYIFVAVCGLLFCLYFFLVGLDLMGVSFQVVGGCTAGSILGEDTNPMAGVMIGIIATTLLQSSSTTTAIIVSLVSGGLDIRQAIYMVFGANVGTAVTAIIVTLAHLGDGEELERAFAGAVVLFVFNILTVVVLLPLEVATGYLYYLTRAMLPASVGSGDKWEGPIKKIVSPLSKRIIIANKKVIEDIANGEVTDCNSYYPTSCEGGVESYATCDTGLIGCDKSTNRCPALFQNGASKTDDTIAGSVCLVLALVLLILCLVGLVALLRRMLLGASTRIIYKATNINNYLAILIGCGVTVLVQSSSITTSTLVPLAGMGVLSLEQMYPLTIGANVGTTFTALMAALVSDKVESLQVALVHLFFNVTGFVLYYPIPFMRRIPLGASTKLGKATRLWRGFPMIFILVCFFLIPLLLLGLSTLFEQQSLGWKVLGAFLVVVIGLGIIYFIVWWKWKDGSRKMTACMANRQRRSAASKDLPDTLDYVNADLEYCKNEIVKLKDLAGLIESGMEPGERRDELHRSERTAGTFYTEEDLDLYRTCRTKDWADILIGVPNQSLGASLASHQRYWGEL